MRLARDGASAAPYVGWSSFQQFPSILGFTYTGISGALPGAVSSPGTENSNLPGVQFQV